MQGARAITERLRPERTVSNSSACGSIGWQLTSEGVSPVNVACTTVARMATVMHAQGADGVRAGSTDQVRSTIASFDAALSLPELVVAFTVT